MLCCIVIAMGQESLTDSAVRLAMHSIISVRLLFLASGSPRMMSEERISLVPLVRDVDVVLLEALVPDEIHEGLFLVDL